jgi:hypothetical protein
LFSGLATIVLMSIILFYRVLISDFFYSKNSIVNVTSSSPSQDATKSVKSSSNGFHSIDSIVRSLSEDHSQAKKSQ